MHKRIKKYQIPVIFIVNSDTYQGHTGPLHYLL